MAGTTGRKLRARVRDSWMAAARPQCTPWAGSPRWPWSGSPDRAAARFPREGLSTAIPGHNAVYVLFGCLLALVGWLAWNAAGAVIWLHAPLAALPGTAINTLLSAAAALVATYSVTRVPLWQAGRKSLRQRLAGGAGHIHRLRGARNAGGSHLCRSRGRLLYAAAGRGAGVGNLHRRSFGRHRRARRIGAVGTGGRRIFCACRPVSSRRNWWALPRCSASCCLSSICSLPLLNRVVAFRVDPDGERIGMDLHELGGGAYPEFVIHRDESYR